MRIYYTSVRAARNVMEQSRELPGVRQKFLPDVSGQISSLIFAEMFVAYFVHSFVFVVVKGLRFKVQCSMSNPSVKLSGDI